VSGRLLAIVMGVIILAGAAVATLTIRTEKQNHFEREAALRDLLATMRKAIADFHAKEGRYPRSLDELVPDYVRRIPRDPISNEPLKVITEEAVTPSNDFSTAAPAKTETYIIDVQSSATGKAVDGTPFAKF
jgi:hypothetical protein